MSAKKRARKARIAAKRKAIGELQFNAEVARIARELREREHPNESALAALDDGALARWMLTQAPDCYRYQYARLRRGWVATTRGSRSAKRRARVNRRDSARVNRAMLRAEALYDRRCWASKLTMRRYFRRAREGLLYDSNVWSAPLLIGTATAAAYIYRQLCRPRGASALDAIDREAGGSERDDGDSGE